MTVTPEAKILLNLLKRAVDPFYAESSNLVRNKGLEQASVFRIGLYLNDLLKEDRALAVLNLDCEYNKNLEATKCTAHYPNGIRPDLLVHKRGEHRNNKLAVEFKGWWNRNHKKDIGKLRDLTSPEYDYKYVLGVFVILKKSAPPEYKLFQNGQEVSE